MKTKVIFSLTFILLEFPVLSQNISLGIKPGFDIVNYNYKGPSVNESFSLRPSYEVAVTFDLKKANWFGIHFELGFAEKGSKEFHSISHETVILKNGYIQLPIIFKFEPIKKFYLETGPCISYLAYMKRKDASGVLNKTIYSPDYKRFELSGVFGIEYLFNKNFSIYLRYNYAFTPFYNSTTFVSNTIVEYKIFNTQTSIGLSYYFFFANKLK